MGKSTLEEMRRLAKQRGGKCVSTRYTDSRVALWRRCRYRHLWKAMLTNIRKGSWCPICAHTRPLTLTEMQALAARRGGECVSDRYVNNETKLRWRCAAGHQWEAAPGLVKARRWCPHCAHVARLFLERNDSPRHVARWKLLVDRIRQREDASTVEMWDRASVEPRHPHPLGLEVGVLIASGIRSSNSKRCTRSPGSAEADVSLIGISTITLPTPRPVGTWYDARKE
jgi:hypothetical protein